MNKFFVTMCLSINILVNCNEFIKKQISLQKITFEGLSQNVIPISRNFQYHHHISKSHTFKAFTINKYQLIIGLTFYLTYFKAQRQTFNHLPNDTIQLSINIINIEHRLYKYANAIQQTNNSSCGVFTIAYVTDITFRLNYKQSIYNVYNNINNKNISRFSKHQSYLYATQDTQILTQHNMITQLIVTCGAHRAQVNFLGFRIEVSKSKNLPTLNDLIII